MPQPEEFEKIAERIGDLPAMPSTVAEVLSVTDSPDVEMSDVGKIIERDPAMTAKILKVSNSSYYGMKQFVGTVKLALVILGVREVRNIVLGISVFDSLKDGAPDNTMVQKIWNDSLILAGMCKRLTTDLNLGLQGEEFIAGLLANIGKMILLSEFGDDYVKLLKEHESEPIRLASLELEQYGFTHGDASAALANAWSLPLPLADALWSQYPNPDRPLSGARDENLAAVLRVARFAVIDDLASDEPVTSVTDAEAWSILDNAKNPIAEEDRRAALRTYTEELAESPPLAL